MRILALDSAVGACSVGVFDDAVCISIRCEMRERGQAARLPMLVQEVLTQEYAIDLVAATVGPGSFTGIRAGLALAHGLAAGWGCPIVGVRVDEVMAAEVPADRPVWVAIHSRAGRVFLARDGAVGSYGIDDLPPIADGSVLVGTAAGMVAARLVARGGVVTWHDTSAPAPAAIAAIGLARHLGRLGPLAAQPLYVDAPEAKLPARP